MLPAVVLSGLRAAGGNDAQPDGVGGNDAALAQPEAVAGPGIAAPPSPPPAAAPARPRRRGCRRMFRRAAGWRHTIESKEKMKRARAVTKSARRAEAVKKLNSMVRGSEAEEVSKDVFGFDLSGSRAKPKRQASMQLCIDGNKFQIITDVRKQSRRRVARGVVSHHAAQAARIVKWHKDDSEDFTVIPSTIDDANVWVHFDRGCEVPEQIRTRLKTLGRRGKNVSIAALSHLQVLCAPAARHAAASGKYTSLTVEAPIMPLPATNWATIHSRYCRWALCSGNGVGEQLLPLAPDDQAEMRKVLTSRHDTIVSLTKDAAGVNHGLVCEEERAFESFSQVQAANGSASRRHMFPLECQSHQCCLSAKPAITDVEGLAGFMTRVGHLLESGENVAKLGSCLDLIVDKRWVARKSTRCLQGIKNGPGSLLR